MLVCLALAGATVALSPQAVAQSGNNAGSQALTIPKPRGNPKATPYTSILTALVIGGLIVVVTLMPSKRGHQD
ncbi:MAG: hypothetical protein Kow0022_18150 [Phycisphaerales bacterium]